MSPSWANLTVEDLVVGSGMRPAKPRSLRMAMDHRSAKPAWILKQGLFLSKPTQAANGVIF